MSHQSSTPWVSGCRCATAVRVTGRRKNSSAIAAIVSSTPRVVPSSRLCCLAALASALFQAAREPGGPTLESKKHDIPLPKHQISPPRPDACCEPQSDPITASPRDGALWRPGFCGDTCRFEGARGGLQAALASPRYLTASEWKKPGPPMPTSTPSRTRRTPARPPPPSMKVTRERRRPWKMETSMVMVMVASCSARPSGASWKRAPRRAPPHAQCRRPGGPLQSTGRRLSSRTASASRRA
jgi:hypothetical protein